MQSQDSIQLGLEQIHLVKLLGLYMLFSSKGFCSLKSHFHRVCIKHKKGCTLCQFKEIVDSRSCSLTIRKTYSLVSNLTRTHLFKFLH